MTSNERWVSCDTMKSFKLYFKLFSLRLTIYHKTWNKHLVIIYTMKAIVIYHLKPNWFFCCCFYLIYFFYVTENDSENFLWIFCVYIYFRTLKSRSSIIGPHWRSWPSPGVGTTSGSGPWSCSFTIPPIFFWRLILYCIFRHLPLY